MACSDRQLHSAPSASISAERHAANLVAGGLPTRSLRPYLFPLQLVGTPCHNQKVEKMTNIDSIDSNCTVWWELP